MKRRQRHSRQMFDKITQEEQLVAFTTNIALRDIMNTDSSPAHYSQSNLLQEEPLYAQASTENRFSGSNSGSGEKRQHEYESVKHEKIYEESPYSRVVLGYTAQPSDIEFGGTIGEGEFGVVRFGRMKLSAVPPYCKDLVTYNTSPFLACAVKLLKDGADEKSKRDFNEEAKILANFNHPNVIRLISVFMNNSLPQMFATEFMRFGDLRGFLRKSESKKLFWNAKEFLFVALQVAKGMEYLQSIRFIHRDLAARNCLVTSGLVVKISDFGLTKQLVIEKDYYKLQTKGKLPVKWMSPEAIGFRRFSHASDVWSFGVVLWEIFSYSASPYKNVHPADLLVYLEKGNRLECPSTCMNLPTLYDWMLCCWEMEASSRPSFTECVTFLQKLIESATVKDLIVRDIGLLF